MKNIITILISLGVVITNDLIGHFFAPNGILFTPIVIIIISILVGILNDKLSPIWKSIILAGLIMIHDVGIKLYSGGRHDHQGLGVANLMLVLGLIPAFVILVVGIFRAKNESKLHKWIAIFLFLVLLIIYLLLFNDLGLGRHYWYEWNG
ncbi:hypothetical protein [Aureivirga sp. CE67]|uniref:hypothetical protein n=1 Tax=Aureivirga sp. CE67 TaxID=1788983 RepID=UPI0018C92F1A|nr:hypothetical protein [Aureivirga sp. CE67]